MSLHATSRIRAYSAEVPGTKKRPDNRYELLTCGWKGHFLVGTDAETVTEADAAVVRERGEPAGTGASGATPGWPGKSLFNPVGTGSLPGTRSRCRPGGRPFATATSCD